MPRTWTSPKSYTGILSFPLSLRTSFIHSHSLSPHPLLEHSDLFASIRDMLEDVFSQPLKQLADFSRSALNWRRERTLLASTVTQELVTFVPHEDVDRMLSVQKNMYVTFFFFSSPSFSLLVCVCKWLLFLSSYFYLLCLPQYGSHFISIGHLPVSLYVRLFPLHMF